MNQQAVGDTQTYYTLTSWMVSMGIWTERYEHSTMGDEGALARKGRSKALRGK